MTDFEELLAVIVEMRHTIAELQHTAANMLRVGTIQKADGEKGYQVTFGNDAAGKPIPSAWFPHPEQGGQFKTWRPMNEGQIVYVVAPGGDQRQAFIVPKGGFSDDNPQPSKKLDENVETFGKVKTTWKADSTEKKVGDKVSVTTTTSNHMAKTEKASHSVEPDFVQALAGGVKHLVDETKVLADAPLFRAVRKVILASG